MDSESLKYILMVPPKPHTEVYLPKVIIDTITLEEVCEEIWLTKNKDDASCVLEAYADKLSNIQYEMLCEIIFGVTIFPEYED